MKQKTPIWGTEGYVDGNGNTCHKTVIVGYKERGMKKDAKV